MPACRSTRDTPHMPQLTSDTSIDHAPSKAVSVLIVDDEADSREALKALLELGAMTSARQPAELSRSKWRGSLHQTS